MSLAAGLVGKQGAGRHQGLNDPRMDRVRPDAVAGTLDGRGLGEQTHGPL